LISFRRSALTAAGQPLRRQIDWDREEIDDRLLEIKLRAPGKDLEEILTQLTQRRLVAEARKWLGM
jgi:hypothetical protein